MWVPFRIQRLYLQLTFPLTIACLLANTGCQRSRELTTSDSPVAEATADDVLQAMVRAYRDCDAYGDRGVLCLRYQQQGTRFHDEAPLSVVAEGKKRLRIHAYQAAIVCDGNQLMAHVADPDDDQRGRQVLLVPAPTELSLDSLLDDPILQAAVTGGAGRLPIQLELLFSDNPLSAVLPVTTEKRLLRATRVEGHSCHGVEVATDEGKFVFWIDQATFVLRRLEYPPEVVPAALGASKPSLVAEFRLAQFRSTGVEQTFNVSIAPNDHPVTKLILPPPPLPSELLGERVENFHFLNPTGSTVTADSLSGQVAALLWFSDHPACESALQQLEQVQASVDPNQIKIIAICTESSQRSHQDLAAMMQRWGVHVPMVRDLRAYGRDRFALPGAPALVVLDGKGVVQFYQVGANPNLAEELPIVLQRIAKGENLAAETRAQYQADMAAFRAAIH